MMTSLHILKSFLLILITVASFNCHAIVPARYLGTEQALNLTITSYNKVINSNRLSKTELVERYIERGLEYGRLFRYRQSVDDFSQAIALRRSSTVAYVHRAVAYARLEQYDKAFADFDEVLRLDSSNLSALRQRAALYYLRGKYKLAAQDFDRYLRSKPTDMYRMLWMYLAETNARNPVNNSNNNNDTASESSVRQYLTYTDLQQWPGALLELYLGEIPLDQLLVALKPILSSWDASHRCEVYFYIAQYHLIQGKKLQAVRYFDQAVKTKAKQQLEYEFAVAYLRRLK